MQLVVGLLSDEDSTCFKLQDLYVKKALEDSYHCRSAYKLIELDDRFHFLQPGRVVIDCGASPGS